MVASVLLDPNATGRQSILDWEGSMDEEGHRTYTVKHLVKCTDYSDGPQTVFTASGLPLIGAYWDYGNDLDGWAFCLPTRTVRMRRSIPGSKGIYWEVESTFSTRRDSKRCQDEGFEDPLLEPDRIGGSFIKYTKEVMKNRDGSRIKTSSHELIRGPQVEFDFNRPTVTIEQNVAVLGLETFAPMIDTVNDATLWGLGPRKVKLSNVSWSREVFGTCDYYFIRTFEFDVDYNGFDREVLDEGTKVLNGHWVNDSGEPVAGTGTDVGTTWVLDDIPIGGPFFSTPDPENPQHFIRYKDRNGENTRVVLNGAGEPLTAGQDPVYINIEYYRESDFLSLGIPTYLG